MPRSMRRRRRRSSVVSSRMDRTRRASLTARPAPERRTRCSAETASQASTCWRRRTSSRCCYAHSTMECNCTSPPSRSTAARSSICSPVGRRFRCARMRRRRLMWSASPSDMCRRWTSFVAFFKKRTMHGVPPRHRRTPTRAAPTPSFSSRSSGRALWCRRLVAEALARAGRGSRQGGANLYLLPPLVLFCVLPWQCGAPLLSSPHVPHHQLPGGIAAQRRFF